MKFSLAETAEAMTEQRTVGHGCIKGKKAVCKYNQDDFSLYSSSTVSMYSVMDGHGYLGHVVAHFVQSYITDRLLTTTLPLTDETKRTAFLKRMFNECHKACRAEQMLAADRTKFDCTYSGTTCTVALVSKSLLTVAFVGDSRCILGVQTAPRSSSYKLYTMTEDQNGGRIDERRRIEKSGGTVTKLPGDVPYRVYVKGQGQPGLAMTRSIGDLSGEPAGIIPVPEISSYKIDKDRETFLVVASDGVWEFLSSKRVIEIVASFSKDQAQEATEAVIEEALACWKAESPYCIDDITCIVAWLT